MMIFNHQQTTSNMPTHKNIILQKPNELLSTYHNKIVIKCYLSLEVKLEVREELLRVENATALLLLNYMKYILKKEAI